MGNQTLDAELGCPVNKCACFYRKSDAAPSPSSRRRLQAAAVCRTQLKPIRMDKGRPWCLCDLHPEEWALRQAEQPWETSKTALLMGQTDSELLGPLERGIGTRGSPKHVPKEPYNLMALGLPWPGMSLHVVCR